MKIALTAVPPDAAQQSLSQLILGLVPADVAATPLLPSSIQLYAHVYLSNGSKNSNATWSSDKATVASVDASGKVTAGAVGGTAVIKAKAADLTFDGVPAEQTCTVTVKTDGAVDLTID